MPSIVELNESMLEAEHNMQREQAVPAGYVELKLSTKGKIGAPASFHIRNFNIADVTALSLTETARLPEQITALLTSMIYEDVDVTNFHENEVIETLVFLYRAFYGKLVPNVDFPIEERDYTYLEDTFPADEAAEKIANLKSKKWVPKTDIDLDQLKLFVVDDTFKTRVTVANKETKFTVSFGLPRFGDVLVLRRWLREAYGERDKEYGQIAKLIEMRDSMLTRYKKYGDVDLARIPVISDTDEENYRSYQIEKASMSTLAIRALHLVRFNGEDVAAQSLAERMKLVQDPRLDISIVEQVEAHYRDLQIGIEPLVPMLNPLTEEIEARRWSFRIVDLLQAIQLQGADHYDLTFD